MDQAIDTSTAAITDVAGKLAEATQAMADALHNINAQFESLHAKIDRIVAAVDDRRSANNERRRCVAAREAGKHGESQPRPEGAVGAGAPQDAVALGDDAAGERGSRRRRADRDCGAGEGAERIEYRAADCGESGDGEGGDTGVVASGQLPVSREVKAWLPPWFASANQDGAPKAGRAAAPRLKVLSACDRGLTPAANPNIARCRGLPQYGDVGGEDSLTL